MLASVTPENRHAEVPVSDRASYLRGWRACQEAAAKFVGAFLEYGGDADELERGIRALKPPNERKAAGG
jgi:hypothetical protein